MSDSDRPVQGSAALRHARPLRLSHGTLTCRDLARSRRFYEEFLGLECVQHQERAMLLTIGRDFAIVCLEIGEKANGTDVLRHWGIDLESRDEVDRLHELALRRQEEYGIRTVRHVSDQHGAYSFYFEDCDGNWWEFEHVGDRTHGSHFERGNAHVPRQRP